MRTDLLTVLTTTDQLRSYWLSKRGDWYWSADGTRLLVCPFGRGGRRYEYPRPLVLRVVAGRVCSFSRGAGAGSGLCAQPADGRPAQVSEVPGDWSDRGDVSRFAMVDELAASTAVP